MLGGELYQDIPSELDSQVSHHQEKPYHAICHEVELVKDGPMHRLYGCDRVGVNSLHHQGVKILAPSLQSMAESDDGLVEAFYRPESKFVWGVQWHPEYNYTVCDNSKKLFHAFVEHCGT